MATDTGLALQFLRNCFTLCYVKFTLHCRFEKEIKIIEEDERE